LLKNLQISRIQTQIKSQKKKEPLKIEKSISLLLIIYKYFKEKNEAKEMLKQKISNGK